MKMPKSKFAVLFMSFTLLLAGCSGGGGEESEGSASSEKNPVTDRENEIVIGVTSEPQNWDPIDTFLLDWSTVAATGIQGPLERSLDLELQPGLAESWEL